MPRKGSDSNVGKKKGAAKQTSATQDCGSVHRKNLRALSTPLIFLFTIFRVLAFQLWLLLLWFYEGTVQQALVFKTKQTEVASKPNAETNIYQNIVRLPIMSAAPGDASIYRQKRHQHKAFEYISKALKIDEEEQGQGISYLDAYSYDLVRDRDYDRWLTGMTAAAVGTLWWLRPLRAMSLCLCRLCFACSIQCVYTTPHPCKFLTAK